MSTVQRIPYVKPKAVFRVAEDAFPAENIDVIATLPPTGIGSLLTLEVSLIVAVLKLVRPTRIFEFGTFNGSSALLFARNTASDSLITTLDLPLDQISSDVSADLDIFDADENDEFLRQEFRRNGAFYLDRAPDNVRGKVVRIFQDSLLFDPQKDGLAHSQDLVFIDGGHDYKTVKNDTEKAVAMCKPDHVLIWHDFGSSIHTEVEKYLSDVADDYLPLSVAHTMLAFSFGGRFAELREKILAVQ